MQTFFGVSWHYYWRWPLKVLCAVDAPAHCHTPIRPPLCELMLPMNFAAPAWPLPAMKKSLVAVFQQNGA